MKVLVTRELPIEGIAQLFDHFEVEVHKSQDLLSAEELKAALRDKDGVLCVGDKIDSTIMDAAPKLKVISNFGVGYDNIDIEYATNKGILVTNLPDEVIQSTAEMTWALILSVARRVVEADRSVRSSESFCSGPGILLGTHLYGKRLGVIGLGRIGSQVARRAIPFGMEVVYYDPRRMVEEEKAIPASYVELDTLLSTSDVITIHVPLMPATYHLIDTKEFNQMKKNALIINMARGPIINEKALITALKNGVIKGAGLDVFEQEPNVPQALRDMTNVVLTPHIGTSTYETRVAMAKKSTQSIISVLHGKIPKNVVNKVLGGI